MTKKPGGRRWLFCPHCGVGKSTIAAMEAHIRKEHPKEK